MIVKFGVISKKFILSPIKNLFIHIFTYFKFFQVVSILILFAELNKA